MQSTGNTENYFEGEITSNGLTSEMIQDVPLQGGICQDIYANVNGVINMVPVIIVLIIVLKMAFTGNIDFKLLAVLAVVMIAIGAWYSLPVFC